MTWKSPVVFGRQTRPEVDLEPMRSVQTIAYSEYILDRFSAVVYRIVTETSEHSYTRWEVEILDKGNDPKGDRVTANATTLQEGVEYLENLKQALAAEVVMDRRFPLIHASTAARVAMRNYAEPTWDEQAEVWTWPGL